MLAGLVPPALWFRGRTRAKLRSRRGLCPVCGYDLRGSPGRCPECGSADTATIAG
jgi:rubrerythrin